MEEMLKTGGEFLATEHLKLAAQNLQHFQKIEAEKVTLEAIVTGIRDLIAGELDGSGDELETLLISQAKMLDATFTYFMSQARGKYTEDEKINLALKAQRQAERTIKTLRNLRQQKEAIKREEKKSGERTGINSDART